jgi:3-hydroxybutyryl-CoA dehydrogenase
MQPEPFTSICIIGAGHLGAQIGLHCAVHGYPVCLVDTSEAALDAATQHHQQELARRLAAQQLTSADKDAILDRIHPTTNLREGAAKADLVIEAVPEHLELKRAVFKDLDDLCPAHTLLATNSSSLRISVIEDATRRTDRVLNFHCFPSRVYGQLTMVEVMRGTATSDETIQRILHFARSITLPPFLVRKESTGFIFNRVWHALRREALHVVDDGVASHEDIDRMWMLILGQANGPFGAMDRIGLDVVRDVDMVYYGESGDQSYAPTRLLLEKIEQGELGVKTGKGFYSYPNPAYSDPAWVKGTLESTYRLEDA